MLASRLRALLAGSAASTADGATLERLLRERLFVLAEQAEVDPFGNPILLMALEISRMMDGGQASPEAIDQLVQRLSVKSFADRVDRQVRYLGDTDPQANALAIAAVVRTIAGTPLLSFDAFRTRIERAVLGIVLTAHPTFGMKIELSRALMRMATGREEAGGPLGASAGADTLREVMNADHLPPGNLTLAVEHDFSIEALGHIQDALDRTNEIVLDVAAELYPDHWSQLRPNLITAASWVGYDLDGRTDIAWSDTVAKRLGVKLAQLKRHQLAIARIGGADPAVADALAPAGTLLDGAVTMVEQQQVLLAAVAGHPERVGDLSHLFVTGREAGLVTAAPLRAVVAAALAATEDRTIQRDLVTLDASLASHGLGLAHTHVRLNATQLHNAIRKQVGMETAPNDPSHRRSYHNAINDLLGSVTPVTVNFADLMAERATAKRLFMIVRQMVKYVDADTPVRFLIAETEAGFTLLTALYYARLFGVEDQVEISPLYETAEALERGDGIIEEALRSPHYKDYLKRTGRLTVQFGFSDSGRYLGQMAATFMIERLRLRLAGLLERHELTDVQIVLFNTHGESIGRGGHPSSLADRLRYVSPPVTRANFEKFGIAVKEEVSFQGGDGFLPFMGFASALAVMRGVFETMLLPDPEAIDDPIYRENDYAVEFFATIQQLFESLVEDPNYAVLVSAYGANLVPRTGSRPTKRQHDGSARAMEVTHVSQIRAIPNNAILQQLGLLANTLFGVGRARAKDPELFDELCQRSPRFRRAMVMVETALGFSDLDVLRAHIDTLNPGMWLSRSARTRRPERAMELRGVSSALERLDLHPALIKLYRRLQADFLDLTDRAGAYGGGLEGKLEPDRQHTLVLLHVVRLALIHRIYLLAMHVPDFSPHHGLMRADIVTRLIRLDVPGAVQLLKEIFPKVDDGAVPAAAGSDEPSTYEGEAAQGYAREHETLFDPLLALYAQVLRLSNAIAYQIGAVG
ncbi:MAG TPA: phosphoenolpyruvate carboxylase [Aliidongia sp.]|uniref:phosphoenolpyruvate carboxylase n=1 Tax=Aliidongia sp. TaxID=1914230 RepID=UPI002DDCA4E5|nr:phosphoenolpyruvate carboxylase [Aliidongia sp.]HEV2675898.1 phosphoenolpyruvate carboxylase [Aliidongia sp.]